MGFLEEGAKEIGLESTYNATGTVADFVSDVQQRYTHVEIKPSMFYLLTVGCFIHSTFDMVIWYLMACFCFRPGGGFKVNIFIDFYAITITVNVFADVDLSFRPTSVVRLLEYTWG